MQDGRGQVSQNWKFQSSKALKSVENGDWKVGNDQHTSVNNEIQVEVITSNIYVITVMEYEDGIGIGLSITVLNPTTCLVATRANQEMKTQGIFETALGVLH